MYLNVKNFNQTCGSSALVRFDQRHLQFESPDFYAHCFNSPPMVPLPFPGAIYSVANGDNIYMTADTKSEIQRSLWRKLFSPALPRLILKALKYRPAVVTDAIRREFGLYPVTAKELEHGSMAMEASLRLS